ncbi:MAG: hypothetical protein NTV34_03565 [Proteobacteria bacterium]|nr:hypothetical protein [Pseudomonadota bacterium]
MSQATQQDLGLDDELKLRNACRWLGYFCGISDHEIKSKLTFFPDHELERFPIFDFESHLLDFLNARKGSDSDSFSVIVPDELNHLERHRAQNIQGFLLPQALNHLLPELDLSGRSAVQPKHGSVIDKRFKNLLELLKNMLLEPINHNEHGNVIVQINPFDERISIGKSKINGLEPLTITPNVYRLFLTLMGEGSALVNEVLDHCFGIRNYDPTIHDPKLAQLVTQANISFRGNFSFKRRRNTILLASLNSVFSVKSKSSWRHVLAMYKHRERVWQALSMTTCTPIPSSATAKCELQPIRRLLTPGKWVSREEFEVFFGVSKATICRRINSWLKSGDLQKQGVGRGTVYLVNQAFLNNHAEKFVTH